MRALLILSAMLLAAALAAPAGAAGHLDTVIVSPDDLAGWGVQSYLDGDIPLAFADGPATTGDGSLQFGPISNTPDGQDKVIVGREVAIPTADFDGMSFDFWIDPAAANQSSNQYYLNVYTYFDGSGPWSWYDCRFDFVAPSGLGTGWHTLAITGATPATAGGSNAPSCGSTIGGAPGAVFLVAINAGDTSSTDTGLEGAFDTVIIEAAGAGTLYDFEAAANVPQDKDDCKKGGWEDLERLDRTPFKNQGQCIKYVNTGR